MPSAKLTFCGAARGVTGSCYHLALDGVELLVDCGIFQGAVGDDDADDVNRRPFPFDPARLAAVVLTHGHVDHCGRLPLLSRRSDGAFRGPVLGHPATLEIARIIMADSAKIAQHAHGDPLYDDGDVTDVARHFQPLKGYRDRRTVGPFTIELFDAGHILGSSSVRVSWRDPGAASGERAILFSGDLGVPDAPILRDPNRAWDPERHTVDWVVTESTYGDKLHPARAEARRTFREVVERATADGGKVLIPAFALGRTQDILYELDRMIEGGELRRIPVIIDGPLALSATQIYRRHPECYDADAMALLERGDHPLELDHLIEARDPKASRRAVAQHGPAIIVAGSGMCNGGRILHHLEEHLGDPRTDVLLVGYQAARTLGRALQDGAREVRLHRKSIDVRAKVTTISGFSAHGDRDALAAWHAALPRRDGATTFVTHGEERSSLPYAQLLGDRFGARTVVPSLYDTVELG
ncbi:MAG: MBL fold metallo-hydrolase [Kofleriaceae bacterium]|nr:MBL fold metallo-hydrolase [Kofleriaceae bacterium]